MNTLLRPITLAEAWRDPVLLLAVGFGAGCARRAPGTFGTLAALPLCWLAQTFLNRPLYGALTLLLFIAGVWICERAAVNLGVHDHPGIVWDEIVGLFITMVAAPPGVIWLAAGFVLFRLFDILKPWPIFMLDRQLRGGFGIMADDVLAAVYAWLALQMLVWLTGG